jgi:hypothetical protein
MGGKSVPGFRYSGPGAIVELEKRFSSRGGVADIAIPARSPKA